jgi:hypothetical protein
MGTRGAVDAAINRGSSARFRRPLVKFSALALAAMLPAAGALLAAALPLLMLLLAAARHGPGVADVRIRPALTIARVEHDLELVQLVPFGVGTLALGNRLQLLQSRARRNWFGVAHIAIISFFSRPLRCPLKSRPAGRHPQETDRRQHGR